MIALHHPGRGPGPGASVKELTGKLEGARTRAFVLALCEAGLWGLAAGLAAYCVTRIYNPFDSNADSAAVIHASLAAGLIIGLLVATSASLRRPDIFAIACRADEAFSAKECFSTALELGSAYQLSGAFDRLVIARAIAAAESFDSKVLFPVRLPRAAVPVLLFALTAIVLYSFPANERAAPPDFRADPVIGAHEQASLSAEIRSVATSLAQDAESRSDPYIGAVANELLSVSRDLANGRRGERATLISELERLRTHSVAAYTKAGRASPAPNASSLLDPILVKARALGPLADPLELPAPATSSGGEITSPVRRDRDSENEHLSSGEALEEASSGPAAPAGQRNQGALPERITSANAACLIDGEEGCMAPRDTNYVSDRSAASASAAIASQPAGTTSAAENRGEDGEGLLIGPATRSGRGDSTQAGRGSEALLGDAPDEALSALAEHLILASRRRAENGAQASVLRAPVPEQFEVVDLPMADITRWRQLPERPTAQNTLPPAQRDVLTRYFAVPRE